MTRRKPAEVELSDREILEHLSDAFKLLGRSLPTTVEEVAKLEANLGSVDLPPKHREPPAILRTHTLRPRPRREKQPAQGVVEELRQAARFGKEIPMDVRARMDEDRIRDERIADYRDDED